MVRRLYSIPDREGRAHFGSIILHIALITTKASHSHFFSCHPPSFQVKQNSTFRPPYFPLYATQHCSYRIPVDVVTRFLCEDEPARWKVPIVPTSLCSCILLLCNRDIFFLPGSEWDYVILSLVRSLPKDEIDPKPPAHWIGEKLGFITDPHQINVGLTRARRGMCIIGECSSAPATWAPCITSVTRVCRKSI